MKSTPIFNEIMFFPLNKLLNLHLNKCFIHQMLFHEEYITKLMNYFTSGPPFLLVGEKSFHIILFFNLWINNYRGLSPCHCSPNYPFKLFLSFHKSSLQVGEIFVSSDVYFLFPRVSHRLWNTLEMYCITTQSTMIFLTNFYHSLNNVWNKTPNWGKVFSRTKVDSDHCHLSR